MTMICGTVSLAAAQGAAAGRAPMPHRSELANGLRLLVIEQPHLPMVVVNALIDAGSRFEKTGEEGLANLAAVLLTEGTRKRSAADVHEAIDFLGGRLSAAAGDDYATLSLTIVRKDLDEGMDLFAETLRSPAFRKAEFERKKDEALAELEADDQNPSSVADREFRKALFGSGPYRSSPGGWKESVQKLAVTDVKRFYEAMYRPERTVLVASGNVTTAEMEAIALETLGGWKRGGSAPELPKSDPPAPPSIIRIDRDLTQANLVWGHAGTTRADPEWYAISVMNYILGGGGFSSRMMNSVRVESGLAYSVFSYFRPGKLPGSFQVGLQTKSASTARAIELVEKEISRIRKELVSDDELSDAKKYLTGSFPLKFDSNGEMVAFYTQVEYYGLGLDYADRYEDLINAVTAEDVRRVAQKYLQPDESILVVIGKQSDITLPAR